MFGLNAFSQVSTGLIAKYFFNGNANDEAGTHNGNVFGATLTTDRFGNKSAAYQFDHNNSQYIEVPYSSDFTPGSKPMSISVWFLSNVNYSFNGSIIDWYRCGANPGCNALDGGIYQIALQDISRLYFDVRDDNSLDSSYVTSKSYNDNRWHHAVLIFDPVNDFRKYYVDNILLDSVAVNIVSLTDGGVQIPLEIGRVYRTGWSAPTSYYNGKIDDISIYKRTLSAREVDSLFNGYTPVGIPSAQPKYSFSIFPNPTNGIFNIQNNSDQLLQFTLYNSLGEKIISQAFRNETSMIDLSAYPISIYFYRLTSDKYTLKTGKIIKQ